MIFLGIFLGGGGAPNSSLPPGARYPRYATERLYGFRGQESQIPTNLPKRNWGQMFKKIIRKGEETLCVYSAPG